MHQYRTERRALNHWENLFERCDRIQTSFDAHSSLPVLDGQIFIWQTGQHVNEDLVGRVEAQVKGRTVKQFSPHIYLRRKDLLAMQQSGGLLLLVVQFLESNVDERRAYYRMLFEPDLGEILRATSGAADEVRVPLHDAPLSSAKLHAMVELSARRAKRGVPINLPESLIKSGFRMTFEVLDELDFNQPVQIGPKGAAASILGTLDNGEQLPIKGNYVVVPEHFFPTESRNSISSETVSFKDCLIQLVPPNDTRIFPSPGLMIRIPSDGSDFQITNRCSGRLSNVVKELQFASEVVKSGYIDINGERSRINSPNDLERTLSERASFFRDFEKMILKLGGDPALIVLSEIEERSWRTIELLIRQTVYGEPIPWDFSETERAIVSFGPMQLQLVFTPAGDEVCVSALTDSNRDWSITNGRERIEVIGHELLSQEELNSCVNLNLETLVESFESLGRSQDVLNRARGFVNRLIEAADVLAAARKERLSAALALNDWVGDGQAEPVDMMAYWQIRYRMRCLNVEDRSSISEMLATASWDDRDTDRALRVMCRILLGQTQLAIAEYQLLPERAKTVVDSNPIFKLIESPDDFFVYEPKRGDDWETLMEELERELWQKVAEQVATASNLMPTFPELNHSFFDTEGKR